jgi:ABC transporter with metal-binding/Fe-S-binding domain ATP-binding protein
MRVAALFSGGKDSTYAAHIAEEHGSEVAFLVSIEPARPDSWMFHSVNIYLAPLLAEAMGKRHISAATSGEKEEELDDLAAVLCGLGVEGVVSGAVASTYQRRRVDAICGRLGLTHVAPLWGRRQEEVLAEEAAAGMKIIVTAVAAMGLDGSWLGRALDEEAIRGLIGLGERYGLNVCGEGGEYESLVLDAPWFSSRLEIIEASAEWDGSSGVYRVKRAELVSKLKRD